MLYEYEPNIYFPREEIFELSRDLVLNFRFKFLEELKKKEEEKEGKGKKEDLEYFLIFSRFSENQGKKKEEEKNLKFFSQFYEYTK